MLIIYIISCLERTKQDSKERIQAMKLIRHFMEIEDISLYPRVFVQALTALVKQQDDILVNIGIETLCLLGNN